MRNTLALFLLFFISAYRQDGLLAQNRVNVDSEIDAVTVYTNGAIVNQVATFDLKAGVNEIVFSGIPSSTDFNTIQVSGDDSYEITGIKQQNRSGGMPASREVKTKRDSLDTARFSLKTKAALRATYAEELLMIQANRAIGGKNSILLTEDLEEMADFFRERIKEINYKTIEIQDEERELNELIQRLERELVELNQLVQRNSREVVIRVAATKTGRSSMKLSYYTYEASWAPHYDVRSGGTSSQVEIISKARIRQYSGINWTSVKLTLSTGDPMTGGAPPVLQPWRLYAYDPPSDKQRAYSGAPQLEELQTISVPASRVAERFDDAAAEPVSMVQQRMATQYVINTPYDIAGDNRDNEVEIRRVSMPATYRHLVVPKLSTTTFLTAEVTNWDQYNLLPGEASIYFEGSFVGQSYLNTAVTSDTLSLSLGRDKNVNVTYEQISDYCKTSTIGNKRKTTRGYRIQVMNTGKTAINLRIEDQVPVSSSSDVEVEVEELSGGRLTPENGKVTWDRQVEAGRMTEHILRYQVRYPKKKIIPNL